MYVKAIGWYGWRVWRRFSLDYRNEQFKLTLQRHSWSKAKIQLCVWVLITNPIKLGDFHYYFVVRASIKVLANMHACMRNSIATFPLASLPFFLALRAHGSPAALNIAACGSRLIKQEMNAFWMKSSQLGAGCTSLVLVLLIRLKNPRYLWNQTVITGAPQLPAPPSQMLIEWR